MRMTKKITSIVLAVMMVVSMMSVMAFSANAAVGDFVPESEYLTFTSLEDDSSVMFTGGRSGSDYKYNKNGDGWHDYNPDDYDRIWLNKGEYVRFRGSDTVSNSSRGSFSIGRKVAASGNIMSLRLDSESRSQGLTDECFINLFSGCEGLITAPELPETTLAKECYDAMFEGCKNLTTAPALPATTLAYGCYADMFMGCKSLTEAPALPATSLATYCYGGMFEGCTSLTKLPALPATTLANYCYSHMFSSCSNIRISDEAGTFSGIKYSEAYRIPTEGDGTNASSALDSMFYATGGKFTGTPSLNTTYYLPVPTYTVTWKNGETTLETDTGVESGAAPSYGGATPTKASDSDKHYTFSGWSDGENTYGLSDTLPNVTADVTYTAQFTEGAHTFANPTFNWTQDASTGDWDCDTLTLTCTGCDATQDTNVAGVLGATNVKCTADANGDFTYKISKKINGVTYEDTKTLDANGVVKSVTQLKAAAAKGGSWELGNDIDRVINVKCANGFVLDGKNYTVTRPDGNSNYPVFVAADKNVGFTLKNLTIDGVANTINGKPAIASSQKSGNSGDVINLDNVTITNWDFDASNNGAILAFGSATVNMTNCNIDTDSDYDVWGGAASTVNVNGGEVGTVYLNGGTATAELTNGADVDNIVAFAGNTITADSGSNITPPADYKVKDNGDGTYTIVPKDYVAQVGSTKYESLQDALDVVPDGGTVTVLKDITTSGNIFADGYVSGGNRTYTVDLGGYTVSGGTFVVSDGNDVTFKNGTIESASYAIQNTATATIDSTATVKSTATDASAVFGAEGSTTNINGTVEGNKYGVIARGGTLNVAGKVTATNDDGRAITLNKGGAADINDGADIDGAYGVVVHKDANLNVNGGDIAGVYHAVSGNGTAADGPYTINVTGGTLTATNGAGIYNPNAQGTLKISGGNITGSTTAVAAGTNSTNIISGGTFSSAVPEEYCDNGYAPKDNGDGTYGVGPDTSNPLNPIEKAAADINDGNLFGINCDYLAGTLLGVQKKTVAGEETSSQESAKNMRFVAVLDTDLVQDADDYGFVLAKVTDTTTKTFGYDNTNFDNLKANMGNGEKTISAKGTYNNVCGNEAYGNPTDDTTDYKYITCAVNNVTDGDKVIARFYYKKDGKTYYAKYAGQNYKYTACIAAWSDLP